MSAAEASRRAQELIETLELQVCADRKVSTYSGGQRRRLDIGVGLVHRPRLLFLDEPTTGLDPQSRARMWDEVRNLRERGTTVFLTTHYLEEADDFSVTAGDHRPRQDRGRGHAGRAQTRGGG